MTGEVSPLGHGDEVASPGELRASHEDRDRVAELLRVAAGDGRLTAEELDERLEKALTARTYAELAALSRDLPAAPGSSPARPGLKPKDMIRIDRTSGWAKREGRWLVPPRIEVRVRERPHNARLHRGGDHAAVAPDRRRRGQRHADAADQARHRGRRR